MHHITGIQQNDGPFPTLAHTGLVFGRSELGTHSQRVSQFRARDLGKHRGRLSWALRRKSTTVRGWIKMQRTAGSVEGGSTGKTVFKSGKGNLELRLE